MITHEEFQKEFLRAHDCKKCHGKIVAVAIDALGNTYCGYCNERVNYPKPTKEEIKEWFCELSRVGSNGNQMMKKLLNDL